MRDVGGEPAGPRFRLPQLMDGVLQLAGRLVEGPGHVRQFVVAAYRDTGVEPTAAHAPGRLAQLPYRTQHTARGDQPGGQRDGETGQRAVAGGREEGVDVDLLIGHPHDGVQHEPAGQHAVRPGLEDGRHGDRQIGDAVLDDPLEVAVRVGQRGAAQLGGDDGRDGALTRGDADRTVLGEHHPRARLALAGEVAQELLRPLPFLPSTLRGRAKPVCWTCSRKVETAVSWAVFSSALRASR